MRFSLALILALAGPAAAQTGQPFDAIRSTLLALDIRECAELARTLERGSLETDDQRTLNQLGNSIAHFCQANRMSEQLSAMGYRSTSDELPQKKRALGAGSLSANGIEPLDPAAPDQVSDTLLSQLTAINENRISFLQGGDVFLNFALQSDPDAANDLLRRLLGKDPLEARN